MAVTVTFDRSQNAGPGRIRRAFASARKTLTAAVSSAVRPHRASLQRLADMPLTVLGAGGIDFAAFHLGHGWGWLITGVSLLVVEHMIADEA